MSETDEEENHGPKSKEATFMDLDLDLDSSWPLIDQIPFFSNPISPFPTFSDQPCSPLWAFSDDEKLAGNVFSTFSGGGGGLRISDYPRFLSLNADQKNEPLKESNDNKRLPSLHIGLAPLESDGSCVIKERMTQALRYFKESTEQHVLAQVWAPVKNGGRCVLTTSGQPFVLDPHNSGLNQYRMVSVMYMFSVDEESDEGDQGLPGRVFQHKLPEWTPNVQYYSSREFSRLDHAHNYNVQGTLALPVFEPSGQSCVAVIELILTSQKIHYAPEVDKVCKALQAVNLKSSEILEQPKTQFFNQICNKGRHNALAEILEIITVVCETYKLPLAQTWVPCRHRSVLAYGGGVKKSCSSFDGSCMGQICMSTSDVAFYVVDAHIWGFREACAEHHLQAGQGVSGRAFSSHNACFCGDITKFSKTEYPLVHYARLFGLTSCFAICLRSTHTGNDDYVLEFFLPPSVKDAKEQQTLLDTLMDTMKQHFQSLKIASKEELEDEISIKIIKGSVDENIETGFESIKISQSAKSPGSDKLLPNGGGMQHHKSLEKKFTADFDLLNDRNNAVCSETKQKKKTSVKKRGKAEKSISLDVLQQYFAGSLKDAAKSLGVCPTTMKRICRQHGISRWPSRKINKVSRSLSKLKRVIESVSWPAGNNGSNQQISPGHNRSPEPLHENIGSPTSKTPESNEHTKTRSGSREESAGSPPSHGSCQRSPANENTSHILSQQGHSIREESSIKMAHQLNILTHSPLFPDTQESFGAMLVEDCGSSKDLQNLCPGFNWTNPKFPEFSSNQPLPIITDTTSNFGARQEMTTVTIKATYREDIIRFKIPLKCGIVELREEIAKRLKLEVGTFDIKYRDDDRELVLIACDADLQECMDVSSSSGGNMIRLSISDVMASLGSSCESNG